MDDALARKVLFGVSKKCRRNLAMTLDVISSVIADVAGLQVTDAEFLATAFYEVADRRVH